MVPDGVRRIRVVYLDHVARLSGGELALLRTLPPLLDRVEAIVVLAEDGPLAERLRAIGVEVIALPLADDVRDVRRAGAPTAALSPRTLWRLLRYIEATARLLRRLDADLVHTNSLKAAIYGGLAGRLARVPVVWHVRDRIADDYLPRPAVLLVRLASRLLPTAVVANSQATLATLRPRRRSAVVASPVVPDSVVPSHGVLQRGSGGFTVGVVGRLAEWKGQHVFLDAFAQVFAGSPARAWLVGSAMFGEEAYEQRLRDQVVSLGIDEQVDFRGFREDVDAELAEMDVVVHCSVLPEPFGQVVIEAMSAGRPVIASAEGGPAEVVTDGVDGLLVPPRDPALLAAALRRLFEDPGLRQRLAVAGRETALGYSPERTAEGLMAVYRQVLGR
ncbi:MAG: glycosyltransferase [Actinobacteria bacterium]|nr:glycosyltransferase [Actinomycetota bacterium]